MVQIILEKDAHKSLSLFKAIPVLNRFNIKIISLCPYQYIYEGLQERGRRSITTTINCSVQDMIDDIKDIMSDEPNINYILIYGTENIDKRSTISLELLLRRELSYLVKNGDAEIITSDNVYHTILSYSHKLYNLESMKLSLAELFEEDEYELLDMLGKKVLLCEYRIPDLISSYNYAFYMYDTRSDGENCDICEISESKITVNFEGSILSMDRLIEDNNKIITLDDYGYLGDTFTIPKYMKYMCDSILDAKKPKPLTKQEAIQEHRKMWNWIADETEKRKKKVDGEDYFEEMVIPEDETPYENNYCCDYNIHQDGLTNKCISCPIDWGSKTYYSPCMNMFEEDDEEGLYEQWSDTNDYIESANLARQIANLPESKDKEENTNNENIN